MSNSDKALWLTRAKEHVALVRDMWEAVGWPVDEFNEDQFGFSGSYPGLAILSDRLQKSHPEIAGRAREFLSGIPGVHNADNPFDLKSNDAVVASDEIGLLIPLGKELIRAGHQAQ